MIVGSMTYTVTITGSTISHNSATSTGAGILGAGGIYNGASIVRVNNSIITANTDTGVTTSGGLGRWCGHDHHRQHN